VVQMATTGDEGIAVMTAEAYDAFYKWFVEYNGVTLATVTVPEFLSKDDDGLWRRTFTINTGNDFWESYTSQTNDYHNTVYNNATRTLAYTFNDPDGLIASACIRARWANGSKWQTEGPSCVNAASGVALLTLPNVNKTFLWTTYYSTSTTYSDYLTGSGTIDWAKSIFTTAAGRKAGAFLALIVFMGAIALFSFNAIIGVVIVALMLIVLSIPSFQLFPFPVSFGIASASMLLGFAVFMMRRS